MKTKVCPKCREDKSVSGFSKNKSKLSCYSCWCKKCVREYQQKNAKKENASYRKYYETVNGYLRFIWSGMKQRCSNPKNKDYRYYGARGIKIEFEKFNDFYDYIVNTLSIDPHGLTIDRINNNGNYARGNIRFVSQAENNRNRRKRCKGVQE